MGPGPNQVDLSRLSILHEAEASLKRLGTNYIDLYQIHSVDPETAIEGTLITLTNLIRTGKVRYIGCSNLAAWQLMKALGISRQRGLEEFKTTQSYYSIVGRELEREMVPLLKAENVGLLVWSPLAGGFLTGKFTREGASDASARRAAFDFPPIDKERRHDVIDAMQTVAGAHGVSVAQIALAWLLRQDTVTSVIIGAKRLDQLDDNLASVDVILADEELGRLNASEQAFSRVSRLGACSSLGPPALAESRSGGAREGRLGHGSRGGAPGLCRRTGTAGRRIRCPGGTVWGRRIDRLWYGAPAPQRARLSRQGGLRIAASARPRIFNYWNRAGTLAGRRGKILARDTPRYLVPEQESGPCEPSV